MNAILGHETSPVVRNREECVESWRRCLTAPGLTNRQRFLNACHCEPVDHAPIWLMRQAGRVLPEYRALKEKHSFLQLVQTPDLAAEVTLQPIRRFQFDAAILFSDILVVAEALGQGYRFRNEGGIAMDFALDSEADVERLEVSAVVERLQYVSQTLAILKRELGKQTALIGFAGSPWTLANFMLEGGSAKEFTKAKSLFYSNPGLFRKLSAKLAAAVAEFLKMQISMGVDAIQIFDSLGGCLAANAYEEASAHWTRQIISELGNRVPVILFAKGVQGAWDSLVETGAQVFGVDWATSLTEVRARIPSHCGIQGNLDPIVLHTSPRVVATETQRILHEMRGRHGHIFNLGHGVPPTAKLENIESLVETVRSYDPEAP